MRRHTVTLLLACLLSLSGACASEPANEGDVGTVGGQGQQGSGQADDDGAEVDPGADDGY